MREFTRAPVELEASLKFADRVVQSSKTQDVSMRGLFIETDETLPEGAECEVTLILRGLEEPLELKIKGEVQRRTGAGVGIKFNEIDLDSYAHLKNLVMLNAPATDSDNAEIEIKDHRGLKKRD